VVRPGAEEARVDARFSTIGADGQERETVLTRVVAREGRSRAYVDGRMATVTQLAEIGADLVDMHGQHSHQRLLGAAAQRQALDDFAAVDLTDVRAARDLVTQIDADLAALGGDEKSRAREIDLLRFQVAEIEALNITADDEDDVLGREEELLAGASKFREVLWQTVALLGSDEGAVDILAKAEKLLGPHSGLATLAERLRGVAVEAADVLAELRSGAESAEENPERLEAVRARRHALRDLMRKYGDTVADVRRFGEEAGRRLTELSGYAERVAGLSVERADAMGRLREAQREVGDLRRGKASALAVAVQEVLRTLALPHAELVVSVGDDDTDLAGDAVTFLLSANPGSDPLPLSRIASGGELARTMLAIRLVLSDEPGTMVFDEVDAGIGGSAAVAVAGALRTLGERHQVFAVTHLPQVAASAHTHVAVTKEVASGRTFASVSILDPESRVEEIARMISGGVADKSAMVHARDLVQSLSTPAVPRKTGRGNTRR
jgi:DNA repair protein RecN (Recombination protein N)